MKRKFVTLSLAACAAVCLCFGLTACGKRHTHTYAESWTSDETYHWHTATCEHTDEVSGKSEHVWNSGEVSTEPTCTTVGKKTFTCTVCGQTKTEEIAATGHSYSDEWSSDGTYHWHTATCEHTDEVSGKSEHVWNSGEVSTEPTCTTMGEKTFTCTVCGQTKTEEIGATGHSYSDEWSSDETYHWHTATCEHADEVTGKSEHTYVNGVCSVCGHEQGTPVSNGLEFTLNEDNSSYSVTGIGTCTDSNVIIPAIYNNLPVTSIGSSAFWGCSSLTSITIPDSVTSIGKNAFYGCSSLNYNEYDNAYYLGNETNPYVILVKTKETSITSCSINTNTKVIYGSAFSGCSSLKSITIPDSVTSIGGSAFSGCSSLTSITIPDSVTSIGSSAFYGCSKLTSITIPDSVTSIGSYAFYGCSGLTSITIPDSVTSIGEEAFYGCSSLTSVTIGNSVTSIGSSAFSNCSSLMSITIPDSVTSIGEHAFGDCSSLTSVTIGNGVTSIGYYAFNGCSSLTDITFNGTKEQWNAIAKGTNWNYGTGAYIIHCTDGDITKN